MPLLDHFHPPLHGSRRWEGFHHAWATFIAQQLNEQVLPPEYYAESEISVGPELEVDVATMQYSHGNSAGYLKHGISVVIVDVVTSRPGNLHAELMEVLEVETPEAAWQSDSRLYTVAYRAVTTRGNPHLEAWPEPLEIGESLPVMPLWLCPELCIPVALEQSYQTTCHSLRIPA